MFQNIRYITLIFVFFLRLGVLESTDEGTLDCVRIKGTYQWAVYLKCYSTNRKYCWYGCQLPKSPFTVEHIQKDCVCNPIEEQRRKRKAPSYRKTKVPEQCFNPNRFNRNWFQTCIISQRPKMAETPVINKLNNVLQTGESVNDVKPFFTLLVTAFKPAVVKIFKNKLKDTELANKLNAYFVSVVGSKKFKCNMVESQMTRNLYQAILEVMSHLSNGKHCPYRIQNCLLSNNAFFLERSTVISKSETLRKQIIANVAWKWKEDHNILQVQKCHHHTTEIFAWIPESHRSSTKLSSIILQDFQDYFINSKGDDSRTFIRNRVSKEVHYCTSDVGCIKLAVPYEYVLENKEKRIPESFSNLGVQFWRYTSASQENPITDLIKSDVPCLKNKNSLYYIIHGFTDNGKKEWVINLKNALLQRHPDSTIVVVDWEKGAKTWWKTYYYQAAVNTYALGAIVAYAIKKHYTESGCFKPSDIHIIGHSLGGQTAGFVGHTFRTISGVKLGHISGLDPAGPFFGEKDSYLRLDQTDAEYVEVLHTNARKGDEVLSGTEAGIHLKLGVKYPAGHIDFYVNGGVSQPGCLFHAPGCSHVRSQAYFTESIKSSGCKFVGFRCSGNSISAKVENCISKTDYDINDRTVMGFGRTKHAEGIYYVETTSNKNQYCNSTIWSEHPSSK